MIGAIAGGACLTLLLRSALPRTHAQAVAFLAAASILALAIMPQAGRALLLHGYGWLIFTIPLAIHVLWGAARGAAQVKGTALPLRGRIERMLAEIVPAPLARLAAAELTMLSYAFRWTGQPEVPPAAIGFSYHRLVAPMMWAFLCLAIIEICIVHVLLYAWKPAVAWIVFVVSDIGFLYLLGLIGSLRHLPVLLFADHLQVRTGILFDFVVPLTAITACSVTFGVAPARRGTLKASLLAGPNVILEVAPPLPSPKPFGKGGPVTRIALALDDPIAFVEAVRSRMPT
ncbi:hypothetical protein [Novosphingobium sp. JCM 18896]|uniref:hypothetical protein n=1 Tax=Novosphingobium sp. JCM 18896 TaxID=2989731 RepID=UPI002221923E|nr:hypothetical protein [Novosphingobium sp. JCM 18896]MCW1431455.1 hypothetical protein [Novosphingobium sp. JCM 18896]